MDDFVRTALNHKYWIYQPQGKRWWTPEEFAAAYSTGTSTLPEDWMERYKIMNPQKGIAAANIMVKEVDDRRAAFIQRVLDYYQKP